jgi:uncharacterized membrane protein YfcA
MRLAQVKIFLVGALAGAIFGATVLAGVVHLLIIAVVATAAAGVMYRGRRLVLARKQDEKRLKA